MNLCYYIFWSLVTGSVSGLIGFVAHEHFCRSCIERRRKQQVVEAMDEAVQRIDAIKPIQ